MSNLIELTLLYVEDDDELRQQFVRILRPKFKRIYEATDGLEAVETFEQFSPDMMLVDINVPKVDGLNVIEKVRKSDKNIPIVILSAYSDQKKLLRAVKLGLSEYLIKPVPHKKLLAVFEEISQSYEQKTVETNIISLQNGYIWKKEEKMLSFNDELISLTKRERILLEYLIEQLNKVVTFESITSLIWEYEEYSVAYSSLSHLLKRLRKKLPEELIENIYGEGYRITV